MSVAFRTVTAPAQIAKLDGREVIVDRGDEFVLFGEFTVEGDVWKLVQIDSEGTPQRGRPAFGFIADGLEVTVPTQSK